MLDRMIRAARLDPSLYELVEADTGYTREAFYIVLIAAIAGAIGATLGQEAPGGTGSAMPVLIIVGRILGWVIWSAMTLWIGTTLTRGPDTHANIGEMLRTLGYAHSPLVLSVLAFMPGLGSPILFVTQIWTLLAGVVAIRQVLGTTTERAVLTAFLAWLILMVALLLPLLLIVWR